MPPAIEILTTGGTIASTYSNGVASPTKRGRELIDAIPALGEHADLSVNEICNRGSVAIDWAVLGQIADRVRDLDDGEADGVVITHGTDTMEESAYFLDLVLDRGIPVVLTGAQRGFDEVSSDGPANVLAAVRSAGHPRLSGRGGVYVALNEELHAARDVTKSHTHKLETFRSPEAGPVAVIGEERFRFYREPGSRSVHLPAEAPCADVRICMSGLTINRRTVDIAIEDQADGLVIDATGLGNVAPELADGIRDAIDAGITVVITSRCFAGAVAPKYGTHGGGGTLAEYGAIMGIGLPAHKARIKLILALETLDESEISSVFAKRSDTR